MPRDPQIRRVDVDYSEPGVIEISAEVILGHAPGPLEQELPFFVSAFKQALVVMEARREEHDEHG